MRNKKLPAAYIEIFGGNFKTADIKRAVPTLLLINFVYKPRGDMAYMEKESQIIGLFGLVDLLVPLVFFLYCVTCFTGLFDSVLLVIWFTHYSLGGLTQCYWLCGSLTILWAV